MVVSPDFYFLFHNTGVGEFLTWWVISGPIARVRPNTLVTTDEDLIRKMCAVRSTYSRGDWYRAFKFDADRENLFSEPDEDKHIRMRSRVTAGVRLPPFLFVFGSIQSQCR